MIIPTKLTRESTDQIVRESISSILPSVPISTILGHQSLKDHGADSVDRVEVILAIMIRLGIEEPMSNFSGIPTIDALVDYLCEVQRI